jgi:hypothetical protein
MEQTVVLKLVFVTVTFLELELLELFQKNNCFAHPYPVPSSIVTIKRHQRYLIQDLEIMYDNKSSKNMQFL